MRLLFTALACLLSVSLSAQEQVITYPYNPDSNTDSIISVPDVLSFLPLYGNEFIPEPVMVDGVVITEWLESSSNFCCDSLSSVIDSMQVVLESIESNSGSGGVSVSTFGDTLTMNGESVIVPGISMSNYTPVYGSVTDIDGNTYQTIIIENIEVMAENLKVEKFNNGDPIPEICICGTNTNFMCNTPGWTYYNCQSDNIVFGRLYSGYVIQDSRNVCPSGWSVSNGYEWQQLIDLFVPQQPGVPLNLGAILEGGTNESGLSFKLGGSQGPGGASFASGEGQNEVHWLLYGDLNITLTYNGSDPNISIWSTYTNPEIGTNSISGYNYRYIRCVKD